MKRILAVLGLCGVVLLAGGRDAGSGMNTTTKLLPTSVVIGSATFNGWNYSSVCIKCHSYTPSGDISPATLPLGEPVVDYKGSHYVWNNLDNKNRSVSAATMTSYESTDFWSTSVTSKYGLSGAATNAPSGSRGEMICESCHNVLKNTGYKMLVETYSESTGDMSLCEGCHKKQTNVPLPGAPKPHHPISNGDTSVGAHGSYSSKHEVTVSHTANGHLRASPVDPAITLGVKYFPSPNYLMCASCHKPHNAMTSTGARLLRRGAVTFRDSTSTLRTDRPVNVNYANNTVYFPIPSGSTSASLGILRQADMDTNVRLVRNADPLCTSCH